MNAWRFHQWHGYIAKMTAPAITGSAEGKLQRPQRQPGQPPRRRICFSYCTIIMIIQWHNTRFSHADWRIYASMNYVSIDLDNGLSPEQRQASIQSRAETSITFQNIKFSFSNVHSKMSSAAECRPFCLWANEIRYQYVYYRQKLGIYIYIYIYSFERIH